MVDAVRQVQDEVRELIRRSGLDPTRHPREIDRLVRDAVTDYDERSLVGGLPALSDVEGAVKDILDTVVGYGPLQKYFDDPAIEEIWINEPSKVFVARGGVTELTPTILTADEVPDLVERMLRASGRRVNLSSPFVDAPCPTASLHLSSPGPRATGSEAGGAPRIRRRWISPSGTIPERSSNRHRCRRREHDARR